MASRVALLVVCHRHIHVVWCSHGLERANSPAGEGQHANIRDLSHLYLFLKFYYYYYYFIESYQTYNKAHELNMEYNIVKEKNSNNKK